MRVETFGNATLYLGDCREILPHIGQFDAVVTDPPYGLGDRLRIGGKREWGLISEDQVPWDELVADVPKIAMAARHAIVWGGQYYSLPPQRGWLFWDKIVRKFSSGHGELAWTTLDQPIRAFNFATTSMISGNNQFAKEHPTQKPLPLMEWCIAFLPKDCRLIVDPFMGSGTTGIAALKAQRSFIGIEMVEKYFDIACRRIDDAARQSDMFAGAFDE